MTDETTPQDSAAMPPASAGSHGAVWNTPSLAMPQPNINVLLWCDQGLVIGYHNGCGDWRMAPIEEEPRPWRLSATNVTHWAALPEPPPLGCRQPSAVLIAEEREAVERVAVAYELLPTVGAKQVSATLRKMLERLGG